MFDKSINMAFVSFPKQATQFQVSEKPLTCAIATFHSMSITVTQNLFPGIESSSIHVTAVRTRIGAAVWTTGCQAEGFLHLPSLWLLLVAKSGD